MSDIQDNPYSSILGTIRGDTAGRCIPAWCFGILKSIYPLIVEIGGQSVSAGVHINYLLLGRNCSVSLTGLSGCLQGSPEDMAVDSGTLSGSASLGGIISPGDRVVLLQSGDGQEYVILCKVVP